MASLLTDAPLTASLVKLRTPKLELFYVKCRPSGIPFIIHIAMPRDKQNYQRSKNENSDNDNPSPPTSINPARTNGWYSHCIYSLANACDDFLLTW
jgi:hypothetical protein